MQSIEEKFPAGPADRRRKLLALYLRNLKEILLEFPEINMFILPGVLTYILEQRDKKSVLTLKNPLNTIKQKK